jgi:hypothetical protein
LPLLYILGRCVNFIYLSYSKKRNAGEILPPTYNDVVRFPENFPTERQAEPPTYSEEVTTQI